MNKNYKLKIMWIFLFLIGWELLVKFNFLNPLIFPSIEAIFAALWIDIKNLSILWQTLFSLKLIFYGILIGVVVAVFLAGISTISPVLNSFVETLVEIAHPLPGIALLPIVIMAVGVNETSIIIIIIHSVLWPLTLNLMMGFKAIPKIYLQVAQNYELSYFATIKKVLLPASVPQFISGLKIAFARAWRAVISAEMVFGAVGGDGGIGWYIFKKRVFMDSAGMYAGLLVIIFIGILMEEIILKKLEKMTLLKWGIVDDNYGN